MNEFPPIKTLSYSKKLENQHAFSTFIVGSQDSRVLTWIPKKMYLNHLKVLGTI